jgi:hypothetical protein
MMRIAMFAALAPVGVAFAQPAGLLLEAPAVVGPGSGRFEVRLLARFDSPPGDAFAGARLDVLASEAGWSNPMRVEPGGTGPGTTPGIVSGSDVTGLIVGQLHFPPGMIYADPSSPIAIWKATFTVTDFSPRTISIATDTSEFAVYRYGVAGIWKPQPVEAMIEIHVVPAPGAPLALCGALALAARRRRREPKAEGGAS